MIEAQRAENGRGLCRLLGQAEMLKRTSSASSEFALRAPLGAYLKGCFAACCLVASSLVVNFANAQDPVPAPVPLLQPVETQDVELGGRKFRLAAGLVAEVVAAPPLSERPICVAVGGPGVLYVAESSGSNDPVQKQLAEKTHKILRLVDDNEDGIYDRRSEFVSKIMFPEGVLWHGGSLYVTAPPQIWKFTDTNEDGVADREEVWYDPQTLTGCANDLHGPYLGLDGWIYWCKGAFAEQTHRLTNDQELKSSAAHIFRRRPEGGPVEAVMNGGMDNPVDVTFTRAGERIFTTTFLVHPGGGLRDGLIHAIYGGLYGKDHDVLDGHVRTGDLMPTLVHMGAAAPAGLTTLETTALGPEYADRLISCSFNLHQVFSHQLAAQGASFTAENRTLLASDDLDFHPTDVVEDADGSLLIVNTGGWYKLCCPTSQLWKPDVLGAIYRIRSAKRAERAEPSVSDAWGREMAWAELSVAELASRLHDERPMVWREAQRRLVEQGEPSVGVLAKQLQTAGDQASSAVETPERAVWTLCQIDQPAARAAIRQAVLHDNPVVRGAAVHAVSLWRDRAALSNVLQLLQRSAASAADQRVAAEALGRLGDEQALVPLLRVLAETDGSDRALEHSLMYALWEIRAPEQLAELYRQAEWQPAARRGLLMALEQQPEKKLTWELVRAWATHEEERLTATAWWVIARHSEWAGDVVPWLDEVWTRQRAAAVNSRDSAGASQSAPAALPPHTSQPAVRYVVAQLRQESIAALVGERLIADAWPAELVTALLDQLAQQGGAIRPAEWDRVWVGLLQQSSPEAQQRLPVLMRALRATQAEGAVMAPAIRQELLRWANVADLDADTRIRLLTLSVTEDRQLPSASMEWVQQQLTANTDNTPGRKMLALDLLDQLRLSAEQLRKLAKLVAQATPYELSRLSEVLLKQAGPRSELQAIVLRELLANESAAALDPQWLEDQLNAGGASNSATATTSSSDSASVTELQTELTKRMKAARADRAQKLEERLARLPAGDIRRGQEVFHSARAACFSCHAMGYLGGRLGPDLSRIGQIRTKRDLLESVMFPSASWVRSYEPTTVVLKDGRVLSGLMQGETEGELVLAANATLIHRVSSDEVEEVRMGGASVMPEGLGELLSDQQIADLLAYLEAAR